MNDQWIAFVVEDGELKSAVGPFESLDEARDYKDRHELTGCHLLQAPGEDDDRTAA